MSAGGSPRVPERLRLLAPASYAQLFRPPQPRAVIVGDSAVENAFALAAIAWFAQAEKLAFAAFWGRSARFHADACRSAAPPASRHVALGGRPVGVLALDRFEPVDLAEDAEALWSRASALDGAVVVLLDPDSMVEARCRAALLEAAVLG